MNSKERIDCALVSRGLIESREKAKAIIMSGIVFVNNQKCVKAGDTVKPDDVIEIRGEKLKYVSRGGLKLEKAIKSFDIDLSGLVCADIGASTGGFTDCMIQCGAKKVYAVDVGYGQLAWKLRTNTRVINLERTNFRYVTNEQIPDLLDFASVDVSFISLTLILPVLSNLLKDNATVVCLIKPQFEAGKENVGKKGVVRDKNVHISVIEKIVNFALKNGFSVLGIDYSPIKGPEGNIEYLCYLQKAEKSVLFADKTASDVVSASYEELKES
ncbi:MAG: TlyA family RNA methyltransferase [Clostridia bacterium]|nr:TlyA family RNA methyltransferase [Clostridia bacterium]